MASFCQGDIILGINPGGHNLIVPTQKLPTKYRVGTKSRAHPPLKRPSSVGFQAPHSESLIHGRSSAQHQGKWRDGIAVPGAVALGFAMLAADLPTLHIIRSDKLKMSVSTAPEVSMSTNLEVLETEVLQLPSVERSHLLERLIASLDSNPEVEKAWEREADRREAELESGSVLVVSGQEAIARLRAQASNQTAPSRLS
jgi:hypothetical protein